MCDENWSTGNVIPPLFPPQGFCSSRGRGGLIKRTAISNTPQFTTVSWPHKEGYVVNCLNTGAWACIYYIQQFHASYVSIFLLWHQFQCYQSFLRCLFLSSLMSADSRGGGDGSVGAAPWLTADEVTSTALESHRESGRWMERRWRLTVSSPWELLHLAGWLCQTLLSHFMSLRQAPRNVSLFRTLDGVSEKKGSAPGDFSLISSGHFLFSHSHSIYLVSLTSRRGQHFFTKCYSNPCHTQYPRALRSAV